MRLILTIKNNNSKLTRLIKLFVIVQKIHENSKLYITLELFFHSDEQDISMKIPEHPTECFDHQIMLD